MSKGASNSLILLDHYAFIPNSKSVQEELLSPKVLSLLHTILKTVTQWVVPIEADSLTTERIFQALRRTCRAMLRFFVMSPQNKWFKTEQSSSDNTLFARFRTSIHVHVQTVRPNPTGRLSTCTLCSIGKVVRIRKSQKSELQKHSTWSNFGNGR
jgi:hypothetical protein